MRPGETRVAREITLPSLRMELVDQQGSGPFSRTHRLNRPSLAYLPPTAREAVRGCFGIPRSH